MKAAQRRAFITAYIKKRAIEKLQAAGFIAVASPTSAYIDLSVFCDGRVSRIGYCDIVGNRLRPFVQSALAHHQAIASITL